MLFLDIILKEIQSSVIVDLLNKIISIMTALVCVAKPEF